MWHHGAPGRDQSSADQPGGHDGDPHLQRGSGGPTCPTQISYTYAGGGTVSVPYAMPLLLTGLPPGTAITVTVDRYFRNSNPLNTPRCCPLPSTTKRLTFTTAAGPLAATAAAEAGGLTLVPNPARGRATLTLATPLGAAAVAQVLDAVGREVPRQVLPARATTAVLDLAGLPSGFYLVRCGAARRRLLVE